MAKSRTSAPTSAQKRLAAQRAAAARERIRRDQQRRRLTILGSSIGAIVLVVAILVVVKVAVGGEKPKSGVAATKISGSVYSQLSSVPPSVFDAVGTGSATTPPAAVSSTKLTGDGKPRVLFVGAEFCPYCAAERWPLAVALSRFGTLHNLGETRSSPSDVYPSTATITFHGATYTSKYLAFTGKELQSNHVVGNSYGKLDSISGVDEKVFSSKSKGYPFIDFGGKYILNAVEYDPSILQGKSQLQIAATLKQPSSAIGKGIIGAANLITARLCELTGNKPGGVCASKAVTTAAGALSGGS